LLLGKKKGLKLLAMMSIDVCRKTITAVLS
jgi:hypothetical protein